VSDSTVTILVRAKHLLEGWRNANRKQNPTRQENIASIPSTSHHNGMLISNGGNQELADTSVILMFSFSKTMWFTPVHSVDVGEALGLHHSIRWIHELQLTNVDFEVDSKRVADYFNKGRGDVNEFSSISIHFCRMYLTNSHVEFIKRQANEVTHTLAKAATSNTSFHVFDDIPTYITNLIFNEMI